MRSSSRKILAVAVMALFLPLAAGCTSAKHGKQITRVNYYPNCYQPIADLRKDDSNKTRNTVAGGVLGAAVGAAVGYMATGETKGALVGAAVGGVAGAASGYLISADIQKKSRAERFAAYNSAMDRDLRGMEFAVAAARSSSDCYEKSFKAAQKQYQAKQISKEEFLKRVEEIRSGTTEANNILRAYSAEVEKNQVVYQDVMANEARAENRSVPKPKKKAASNDQLQVVANRANEIQYKNTEAKKTSADIDKKISLYNEAYNTAANS